MVPGPTPAPGAPLRAGAGPGRPVGRPGFLSLALALALVLSGCAAARAPAPLAKAPSRPDPTALLLEVQAQFQAARGAEVAFLQRYPVAGLPNARQYLDGAHAAVGRARAAAARLAALDRAGGAPDGCCAELQVTLARYDARLDGLASLAGVRGGPASGLRWEAHRTLDGLDRYLDRLGRAEDAAAPPTARADAIRSLKDDVDAFRRYEADYHRRDDIHSIARIGDRVVSQRAYLETSPLDERERARVDTHVRTYLIYIERVAVTDVEIFRARRALFLTAERIQDLVRRYLAGEGAPLPGGRAV